LSHTDHFCSAFFGLIAESGEEKKKKEEEGKEKKEGEKGGNAFGFLWSLVL